MDSQRELLERIEQLEAENAILDEMADGVVAIDIEMNVLRYNKRFAKMWQLPVFDETQSMSLENLKQNMSENLNPEKESYSEALEGLLSFDEDIADLLDMPLQNKRLLQQLFNRENDTTELNAYVWTFRDITRQRRTRKKLYRNQQFLTRILNNSPMMLFAIGMEGKIQYLEGRQGISIFGSHKENLMGQNIFDFAAIFKEESLREALAGKFIHLEEIYNPENNVYSDITYTPLFDEEQNQTGVVGIIQDVTKTHEAERKRKEQQQIFNRVIYNAPVLLIATDTEGMITYSRGKLLNRYNRRQAQDEGENFFELYANHPMGDDVQAAIDGRIVRNIHDFTMYPPGGYSEVTCAPIRDEDGVVSGMVSVAVDVTEQKEAQIEVERQRQYLDRVLSNAPIVMFATDRQGIITFSRGAELRHFGLSQNELLGRTIFPEERHPLQRDIRRALRGHSLRKIHQIGEIYLDIYCTPLLDQDANINGMIGVGVNVTDIKRAEEVIEQSLELRKAKEAAEAANVAKTTFISNMSHELRTPLNSIIGFSQFLVNDKTLSTEQQEYLSLIYRSSEHLLGLINDILEMSKIETGKLELVEMNFDLHELLDGIDSIYRAKASEDDLSFELQIPEAMPRYLNGDRNKLRQILINLLSNAIKYTERGGIVLRTWIDEPEHPDQVRQFHLYFEIEDTGLGIAEDELELLFDPFTQTKTGQQSAGGSGLGLVITKQFAQLMGGDIRVESEAGKGSRFEVDIYMQTASTTPEPKGRGNQQVVGIDKEDEYKLLVVDDKWENRLMLVRTLEQVGFTVREASNGREAVHLWENWEPDLIWMDMRMPIMNGYEATRKIREKEEEEEVVIIALTASAFEHERREVLKAGCNDYMSKPFRHEELFRKMEDHLDIDFVYADPETEEFEALDKTQVGLGMALNLMDQELQNRLQKAAKNYSLSEVLAVTKDIENLDKATAERIAELARNFDFGRILQAIDLD